MLAGILYRPSGVSIGRQSRIRRAILDENVTLGDGVSVGYDLEQDRVCHHVTETGIVVVTSRTANISAMYS
jgi:ADP-glucose pyrophosphorylase